MKEKVYAVYKGDILLGIGTTKELSEKFNVKRTTVRFWTTPANLKRAAKHKECKGHKIAIKIEEE